jgi:hypothetical protein
MIRVVTMVYSMPARTAALGFLLIIFSLCTPSSGWISTTSTSSQRSSSIRIPSLLLAESPSLLSSSSTTTPSQNPFLSLSLDELAESLGGRGRALACWECLRLGVDPLWFYDKTTESTTEAIGGSNTYEGWTREQFQRNIPNHNTDGLGQKSLKLLRDQFGGDSDDSSSTLEDRIATLSHISTSSDGTTKLLLQLQTEDAYEIETVIIPWPDRNSSTLCISSQVGYRQACTFCATGRMGKLRNLSSDEILVQVYWAVKLCRLKTDIPAIGNVVFMGMGEPTDNAEAVVTVAHRLVDLFQLAPRRITISTVAPSPKAFYDLAKGRVVLA